jgi:hypothetical protein
VTLEQHGGVHHPSDPITRAKVRQRAQERSSSTISLNGRNFWDSIAKYLVVVLRACLVDYVHLAGLEGLRVVRGLVWLFPSP